MKLPVTFLTLIAGATLAFNATTARAADSDEDVIKDIMKKYHKAPKGQDNVCKKATMGTASPQEIKDLIAAYDKMAKTKAPKGDEKDWKDRTSKLAMAAHGLEKGGPDAIAKYKEAVNCKACHTDHKPD